MNNGSLVTHLKQCNKDMYIAMVVFSALVWVYFVKNCRHKQCDQDDNIGPTSMHFM